MFKILASPASSIICSIEQFTELLTEQRLAVLNPYTTSDNISANFGDSGTARPSLKKAWQNYVKAIIDGHISDAKQKDVSADIPVEDVQAAISRSARLLKTGLNVQRKANFTAQFS